MNTGLGLRLESLVSRQDRNDPYVKGFLEIIGRIREKIKLGFMDFEVDRDDDLKALTNLINNRFRINVNIVTNAHAASVVPFFGNDAHILMRELFRSTGYLKSENEFMKSKDIMKGSVDIESATLGGDFSKAKSTLYLNFNRLLPLPAVGYGLSDRQVCAVATHEIGHIFYPLVYSSRLDQSNLILENANKEILSLKGNPRELVYKAVNKITKANAEQLSIDLTSDNPDVMSKAAIKLMGETMLQHQVNAKYSNANFEMLADNFAARFGLGAELVQSLEKMTPGGVRFGDVFRAINETVAIMVNILNIYIFVRTISNKMSPLSAAIISLIWFFMRGIAIVGFFYILVRMSGESSRDYTYDDLVIRYTRIRAQMIEAVKSRDLTKGDATRLIEQIDQIGNVIKSGRNWRTPLDIMFNTFNPSDRRAKDSIERQQALEAMVNNDLFLSSLKLSNLAN